MEDTIFGLVLFCMVYGFLLWLTDTSSAEAGEAWELNEKGEIVVNNPQIAPAAIQPIEQQMKDLLWSDDTAFEAPQVKAAPPTVADLLDGIEIEKLTLRKARKVAKALNIRQKVNGKDQPKHWLLAQIRKRFDEKPQETARAIRNVCQAA